LRHRAARHHQAAGFELEQDDERLADVVLAAQLDGRRVAAAVEIARQHAGNELELACSGGFEPRRMRQSSFEARAIAVLNAQRRALHLQARDRRDSGLAAAPRARRHAGPESE
jgi:hypothetical protein